MSKTRWICTCMSALVLAAVARTQSPPSYALTFLGPASGVSGLSENGLVIGHASIGGATRAWVAAAGMAMQLLPLAPGDHSSWAHDVNELGVIVGSVSPSTTSPEFGGRAVAWFPDGLGGHVLQELGMLPGHAGSDALAVNNLGDIVGYSRSGMFRYAVWFTAPGGVQDLNPFGVFDPQSINDQRQFCDRLGKRMDLDTFGVEVLTLPTGTPHYQAALGYAINEFGQVAGTLVLSTSTSCVYQAARHVDGAGWQTLTPCSPLANASDLNDLGDTIYQAYLIYGLVHLEGVGDYDVQSLLAPSFEDWDLLTAFGMDINSARQLAVMATDPVSGQAGAALLTPIEVSQADLGFGGPGTLELQVSGGDLSSGTTADLTLSGAPAFGLVFLLAGLDFAPAPFGGGTLVPLPILIAEPASAGPAGTLVVGGIPGGGGPLPVYVQAARLDPAQQQGYAFSNAVRLDFLP